MIDADTRSTYLIAGFVVVICTVIAAGPVSAGSPTSSGATLSEDPRVINYGETKQGAVDRGDPTLLSAPTANDDSGGTWYYEPITFQGSAGDLISANLTAPGTDTVLVLKSPDGETVTINDDVGFSTNSRIIYRLEQDGEYTLRVTSRQPVTTYEYSLSLSKLTDFQTDPKTIDTAETVTGAIDDNDSLVSRFDEYHDNLTLSVERGQRIGISMDSPAPSAVKLFAPNGTQLAVDWRNTPDNSPKFITEIPYGGEYTVYVASIDGSTSVPYQVSVSNREPEEITLSQEERYVRDRNPYNESEILWKAVNTTTAYVGTPIEVRAGVKNTGVTPGTFQLDLLADDTRIAQTDNQIDAQATDEVRLRGRINETGQYLISLDGVVIDTVRVIPRPEPDLSVTTEEGATRATASNASSSSTFDIPVADDTSTDVAFQQLSVTVDRFTRHAVVTIRDATDVPESDLTDQADTSLPRGARLIDALRVETERVIPANAVSNISIAFSVAPEAVAGGADTVRLYRHTADGWTTERLTRQNDSDGVYRYRGTASGTGVLIVAEDRPVFETENLTVSNRTVTPSTNVTASVNVSNVGLRNGTRNVSLYANDRRIATSLIDLSPNETTTVQFRTAFENGTYDLQLRNESQSVTVTVRRERQANETNVTTATPTPTRTATTRTTVRGTDLPADERVTSQLSPQGSESNRDTIAVGAGVVALLFASVVGLARRD
jgi:hypothetical protein